MGLKISTVHKPVAGVSQAEIPSELADLLTVEVPKALAKPEDYELSLEADTEAEASRYSLYARAWGMRQDPQVEIRKIPNRKGMKDTTARLVVSLYDPNATRAGRPRGSGNSTPAVTETSVSPTAATLPKAGK